MPVYELEKYKSDGAFLLDVAGMSPGMSHERKSVKFSELVRWILLLAILVVIVFWASIPSSNLVGSIVFSHLHHGVGGTPVHNGSAFDQAVIDLDKYQRLI